MRELDRINQLKQLRDFFNVIYQVFGSIAISCFTALIISLII